MLKTFLRDETASPTLELALLIPLLIIGLFVCVDALNVSTARAQIDSELRNAVRLASTYGGDCGKYRPEKMHPGDGKGCKGQTVTEKVRPNLQSPSFRKAFHVKVKQFGCHNGTKFSPQGDKGQAKMVGDSISCSAVWSYTPIGVQIIFTGEQRSHQIGASEVGNDER